MEAATQNPESLHGSLPKVQHDSNLGLSYSLLKPEPVSVEVQNTRRQPRSTDLHRIFREDRPLDVNPQAEVKPRALGVWRASNPAINTSTASTSPRPQVDDAARSFHENFLASLKKYRLSSPREASQTFVED
jgi:hypothetical protein